ncbi:hypothetical protein vseg_003465 [Gypsophila vaccaria]
MARKSNHQKQRELNIRGRSIARTEELEGRTENFLKTGDSEGIASPKQVPNENSHSKMKNINEIVGITALQVETDEELEEELLNDVVGDVIQSKGQENRGTNASDETFEKEGREDTLLQLEKEDVHEELEYWKNAVVCFIMGANPPGHVIEGFVRRISTKFSIDKISILPNGVFLVRFNSIEMKQKVLNSGYYLFDNKPLIVKDWNENMELNRAEVKTVPVWVQLRDLPLKFWGKSLPKIAGIIGNFIKGDKATQEKTRLEFARVMVEMHVEHPCPERIVFKDELRMLQQIEVIYEWKPVSCQECKGMGHRGSECRKAKHNKPVHTKPKQEWRPVTKPTETRASVETTRNDPSTPLRKTSEQAPTQNGDEQGGYSNGRFGALSYREILSLNDTIDKVSIGNAALHLSNNG